METKRLYECLLLIDPAIAAGEWDALTGNITSRIEKRGGEIVSLKKWDERQLAYEIDKKSRGTYILVYFKSEPEAISVIERDFNFAEDIMRIMILRADFITSDEQMDKPAPTIVDVMHKSSPFESDSSWSKPRDYINEDVSGKDDVDDEDIDDEGADSETSEEEKAEQKTEA